jgi:bacterioferritin (cytochrome b1)
MRTNENLLTVLNKILVDELKAVNPDMIHSKANGNLGYGEIYEEINKKIGKEITEELKQAEWLIKRIIYLEAWRILQPSINVNQNTSNNNFEKRSNVG